MQGSFVGVNMGSLKIINKNPNPLWKRIPCTCSKVKDDVNHKHPILKCDRCYCEIADLSVPTESFKDSYGFEVKEITLTICKTYGNVIGWKYQGELS